MLYGYKSSLNTLNIDFTLEIWSYIVVDLTGYAKNLGFV